jgi:hypothetical protein
MRHHSACFKLPAAEWSRKESYAAFCRLPRNRSKRSAATSEDFHFTELSGKIMFILPAMPADGSLACLIIYAMFFQDGMIGTAWAGWPTYTPLHEISEPTCPHCLMVDEPASGHITSESDAPIGCATEIEHILLRLQSKTAAITKLFKNNLCGQMPADFGDSQTASTSNPRMQTAFTNMWWASER